MKKVLSILSFIILLVIAVGCDGREKLYVLSWGEYINEDVIAAFEEEFGVRVVITEATSNESMHNRIQTNAGQYDIVIPSDYMMERMVEDDLLHELDFSKLPNYSKDKFDPKLQELRDNYFEGNEKYGVPYFWGTLGIMYNDSKQGVKELVEENSWAVFFEQNIIPSGVTVGMYDSSRDAVAAGLLYLDKDLNTTIDADFNEVEALLKGFNYSHWGTDDLKEAVASKNLDIALVYSGDFFDQLYFSIDNDIDVTFDMFVDQERNNVWFDAMVIPKTSASQEKIDLAHAFINFFLDEDNALENATYIGYCPPLSAVYDAILEDEDISDLVTHPGYYPGTVDGQIYRHLGSAVANRMDEILNRAKIR
ncbi:MAG: extracellular solute-binding protein [Bacilli bacterium]